VQSGAVSHFSVCLCSTHAWPAEPAFLIQYAAAWSSSIKSATITFDVSWTTTAAAAATAAADDVTTSHDVITSTDDVTASVDDVIVSPTAAAAAAADNDGSRKQLVHGAIGDGQQCRRYGEPEWNDDEPTTTYATAANIHVTEISHPD